MMAPVHRVVALTAGLAGALLLAVAEFTTVVEVVVGSLDTVRRSIDGGDNHDHALLVVALASVPMTVAAARTSRPAALALVALGVTALGVALGVDLPDTSRSGDLEEAEAFEQARTRAGTGLYLEIVGGALLLLAGGLLWKPDSSR